MDTSRITHGLIIDQPWIDYILDGRKTWEMRSTSCSKRGPVALIKKGSKRVVAIANLTDSEGPLTTEELEDHIEYHQVPAEVFCKEDYKWFHAWKLSSITPLDAPVHYFHKNGSVIWAELDDNARKQLSLVHSTHSQPSVSEVNKHQSTNFPDNDDTLMVPVARDGSIFCPELCSRNGVYTVGSKGDEQRFSSFMEALGYLRKMPVACWRRPNSNGNWGIVSAVEWTD